MKIEAEDLWPLVLNFVETYFGDEQLAAFKKFFKLKIDHENDPIVKAGGIQALLANYLKHNKEVFKTFKKHLKKKEKKDESSEDESDSDKEDKKKKSKKLVGQKRKAKDSSDESESESEKDKKKKAKKESSDEEDSDDDDNKKKKNGKPEKRQRASSISSRTRSHSDENHLKNLKPVNSSSHQPAAFKFQRINEDKYKNLSREHADASFESKAHWSGVGDKFGEWSNDRLKDKVGAGFKKEKQKMKNRNFHSAGQRIQPGVVNSIKL